MVIEAPGATIGSSVYNDLVLERDHTVSSLHARLQLHANAWWLIDCDSANGTYMLVEDGGRRVAVGDVFRIARCELQVYVVASG